MSAPAETGAAQAAAAAASPAASAVPAAESPLPPALRWAGPFLAAGYGFAAGLNRFAFGTGLRRARSASIPVLSIGNLTAGGTGKTPAVAYFARELSKRGRRPAVLMRGYRAPKPGGPNDEARELQRLLPGVPVIVNPDRVAGSAAAAAKGCDLVVLDDGFQHYRLCRDLDVVLLDATDPFGGGHLLPWGRLREGPGALARAGAVILTRCDQATPAALEALRARVKELAPDAELATARHAPDRLRPVFKGQGGEGQAAQALSGKKVLAVCGLGNPAAFAATLRGLGADVAGEVRHPDHVNYLATGLDAIKRAVERHSPEWIVVSGKDAVKLEALERDGAGLPPVWALSVAFELREGAESLWQRIDRALAKPGPKA